MADLKHAKDLQPSYDLALSHNGTEKWADNFAVRMIERIDDLERQLAEMTADRNLWKDDHDGDCPYKTQLAEAKKPAQWKKASPENLPKKGQFWVSINQASRIIHDCGYAHHDWAMSPSQKYLDYYFIAPPQPEKPSTTA